MERKRKWGQGDVWTRSRTIPAARRVVGSSHGLVTTSDALRLAFHGHCLWSKLGQSLQPGPYILSTEMRTAQLLSDLRFGPHLACKAVVLGGTLCMFCLLQQLICVDCDIWEQLSLRSEMVTGNRLAYKAAPYRLSQW